MKFASAAGKDLVLSYEAVMASVRGQRALLITCLTKGVHSTDKQGKNYTDHAETRLIL